ncbi:MAG: lytic transglycosylase domain-containing protein [Coriobacteriia bacterium]
MKRWLIRVLLLGIVGALAAAAFLGSRGPALWQRQYYPLKYEAEILDSARRHAINPYLIAAVINSESNWNADAESHAGAVGLMQVMPATAADMARNGAVDSAAFPLDRLSDPGVNIEYGTAYLRYLVSRYHEVEVALAAYNAGLSVADRWIAEGGDIRDAIDYPETKRYVLKVVRAREQYESLYPHAFDGWTESE